MLLQIRPKVLQGFLPQRGMSGEERTDADAFRSYSFHGFRVQQTAQTPATVLLLDGHAENVRFPCKGNQLVVVLVFKVEYVFQRAKIIAEVLDVF